MLDRRKAFRGRVYYGARIAFNERRSTIDCIIRNFSTDGAKVDLADSCALSDEVDLTVARKGLAFRGRMLWRRNGQAGFQFRDPKNVPVAMTLDWALRLRASERATRALLAQVERLRAGY